MNDEITRAFVDSYKSGKTYEIIKQIGGIAADWTDALLGIPVFSVIDKLYNLTRNFLLNRLEKKLLRFLFNISDTTKEERIKFLRELTDANKEDASGVLLEIINGLNNTNKIDILTNLMQARIKGAMSIENFVRLCSVLERIPYPDLYTLGKYATDYFDLYSADILLSAGILTNTVMWNDDDDGHTNLYRLNSLGTLMLKYGLNVDVDVEKKNFTSLPGMPKMVPISSGEIEEMWRNS